MLISDIFSIQFSKGLLEFNIIEPKKSKLREKKTHYCHAKKKLAIIKLQRFLAFFFGMNIYEHELFWREYMIKPRVLEFFGILPGGFTWINLY